jgi:hypothetical protein
MKLAFLGFFKLAKINGSLIMFFLKTKQVSIWFQNTKKMELVVIEKFK